MDWMRKTSNSWDMLNDFLAKVVHFHQPNGSRGCHSSEAFCSLIHKGDLPRPRCFATHMDKNKIILALFHGLHTGFVERLRCFS